MPTQEHHIKRLQNILEENGFLCVRDLQNNEEVFDAYTTMIEQKCKAREKRIRNAVRRGLAQQIFVQNWDTTNQRQRELAHFCFRAADAFLEVADDLS